LDQGAPERDELLLALLHETQASPNHFTDGTVAPAGHLAGNEPLEVIAKEDTCVPAHPTLRCPGTNRYHHLVPHDMPHLPRCTSEVIPLTAPSVATTAP